MLIVATALNAFAYYLFIRLMKKYFQNSLEEERKQLSTLFTVFLVVVTSVVLIYFSIVFTGTKSIIKNITVRWFAENLFAIF